MDRGILRNCGVIGFGLLVVFCFSATASAGTFELTDTTWFTPGGTLAPQDYIDHGWGDVNKLDGMADYVAWAHNFQFNPPMSSIISGTLEITLRDDEQDRFCFGIPINGEWGFGVAESWDWALGEVDSGVYTYNVNVQYLADGRFQILLGSLAGDFYIDESKLTVVYQSVPEPSFLILLGLGLGAVAIYSRKK